MGLQKIKQNCKFQTFKDENHEISNKSEIFKQIKSRLNQLLDMFGYAEAVGQ